MQVPTTLFSIQIFAESHPCKVNRAFSLLTLLLETYLSGSGVLRLQPHLGQTVVELVRGFSLIGKFGEKLLNIHLLIFISVIVFFSPWFFGGNGKRQRIGEKGGDDTGNKYSSRGGGHDMGRGFKPIFSF